MPTINGLDSLMAKLQRIGPDFRKALVQTVQQATEKARSDAQANYPSSSSSQADSGGEGGGRAAIHAEFEDDGNSIAGRVVTNSPHAAYVEFGTGPVGAANHAGISPNVPVSYTSREYWTYPTIVGGKETFRTTSGQPARPFLYPAAKENEGVMEEIATRLLKEVARKHGV